MDPVDYKPKTEFIICGDFNLNFLKQTARKTKHLLLLQAFNVFHIVCSSTRITDTNYSIIDNIFIDNTRINSYDIVSISNGLSDHEAQCLAMNNITNLHKYKPLTITRRNINKDSIAQFQNDIYNQNWQSIYQSNDVDESYNSFLNTYLLIYESCFYKQNIRKHDNDNDWITLGIRTSCKHKENLYILSKVNNNTFKLYYKSYCRILRKVIREAKRLHYNKLITSAENKIKTTWRIIDRETGRKNNNNKDTLLKIFQYHNKKVKIDEAAQSFNKYFSSIPENLNISKINPQVAINYLILIDRMVSPKSIII
jgi:hypothetical protein